MGVISLIMLVSPNGEIYQTELGLFQNAQTRFSEFLRGLGGSIEKALGRALSTLIFEAELRGKPVAFIVECKREPRYLRQAAISSETPFGNTRLLIRFSSRHISAAAALLC